MKVLKGCSLVLMSFILFLLLVIFGFAYSINHIALNPHYIVKVLNDIDFSPIIQASMSEQGGDQKISVDLQNAYLDILNKTQPVIKARVGIALEDTYAYLTGKGNTPNLKGILSDSVMNSQFVADLLDKVDLSELINLELKEQSATGTETGFSDNFQNALITTIDKVEPSLKNQIAAASDPIFKYLLMQTSSIDLKSILRQTFLSNSFMSEVINNLDFTAVTNDTLNEQLGIAQLPEGIMLSNQQIDRVIAALEPSLKTDLTNASGDIADYLIGTKSNFSAETAFAPALPTLKVVVHEAFMAQLPANLQGLPQADIDNAFDQYYADYSRTLPATLEFNSSDLGIDATSGISKSLTNAQDSLTDARNTIDKASQDFDNNLKDARTYVGYFRLGFACLTALIVLLILGIILIYRNVKGACRNLGIVFLIYGAIALAAVLITKFFVSGPFTNALQTSIQQSANLIQPPDLHNMAGKLLNDVTSPLQIVSLICLIGGILLIAASFVYPRLKPAKTD